MHEETVRYWLGHDLRVTPPFLLPHVRVELLLHTIRSTTWDAATWAVIRTEVPRVLAMRRQAVREGWWN